MRITSVIASILVALLPLSAVAAPPPDVKDLQVNVLGGEVIASWEKLKQEDIAYYRVYYSGKSILDNNGEWDDFEQTESNENTLTITQPPAYDRMYISVLAVNLEGEETEFFTQEISAKLPDSGPKLMEEKEVMEEKEKPQLMEEPVKEEKPEEPKPVVEEKAEEVVEEVKEPEEPKEVAEEVPSGPLQLLSATVVSSTRVDLEFSHAVVIEAEDAPKAFVIVDPSDEQLPIKQLVIEGRHVQVITHEQKPGTVYSINLFKPLVGRGNIPLDTNNRSKLFTGYVGGNEKKEEVTEPAPVPPPPPAEPVEQEPVPQDPESIMHPQDLPEIKLTSDVLPNGTYKITAQWPVQEISGGLAGYLVYQSMDGGKSYSEPQGIPAGLGGVEIGGLPAGEFALYVQTSNRYGYVSEGKTARITLGGAAQEEEMEEWEPEPMEEEETIEEAEPEETSEPEPPVVEHRSDRLPQTGTTFVLLTLSFAGAVVGWKRGGKMKK